MLGVYFFAQTEEKGALLKGTLRFSCFIASFKKGVTLRFADYNSKIKLKTNTIYNVIGVFFDNFAL